MLQWSKKEEKRMTRGMFQVVNVKMYFLFLVKKFAGFEEIHYFCFQKHHQGVQYKQNQVLSIMHLQFPLHMQ